MAKQKEKQKQATIRMPKVAVAAVAVLAWGLAIVLYASMAAPFLDFWVDDAGISFSFVRNIAEGYGSVAAPGTERVEGFSNPTWVGLLAVVYKLGGDPFTWSQRLAYTFALATLALICLYAFLPMGDGRRPWPAALAASVASLNASFVIWNQSGMENSLYQLLIIASVVLVIRESRNAAAKPWSALTLVLLAITRPEGVAHTAIAGVFLLLTDLIVLKRPSKRLFVWAGGFLLLFGAYHLWHYIYFARPFPNTYYAKVEPDTWERISKLKDRGWRYVGQYFSEYKLVPLVAMAIPAFFSKRTWREALYIGLTALFLVFFPIYSRGDWMRGWRFLSGFTLPMAMLLGLAALNLGGILGRLLAKKTGAKTALAASILLGVVWVAAPIIPTIAPSKAYTQKFAKRQETTVSRISVRPWWWSKIAYQLAVQPKNTTMTDMDMGGTTYFWPGVMLDIGYLIDAPLATHRYTKYFRRMVDEYYFKERRPEFIHVRRSWGRKSTIPTNPKFKRQYLRLPEDRRFGSKPNGNYVRRDLFERESFSGDALPIEAFSTGLRLVKVEAPAAMMPNRKTPIFLTWVSEQHQLPQCTFFAGFAADEQEPGLKKYEPMMGWLPTDKWKKGRYVRETVYLHAPKREGTFRLAVAVEAPGEERETRVLPVEVVVGVGRAKAEIDRLLDQAQALAERDPVGADQAFKVVQQVEAIRGETKIDRLYIKALRRALHDPIDAMNKLRDMQEMRLDDEVFQRIAEVDRLRLRTYVAAAAAAADRQEYEAAAHLLGRCWRIDAKDDELDKLGWRVADALYEIGREHQAAGKHGEAYRAFAAACKAQPQHAWARRRAEESRTARFTRR